nr:hypothetical protein [Burkholderia sp. Tr-20390]
MTVARLNGSHGSLDWHRATIELIRRPLPDLPILLDIPGRKIRTVQLRTEPSRKARPRARLDAARACRFGGYGSPRGSRQ